MAVAEVFVEVAAEYVAAALAVEHVAVVVHAALGVGTAAAVVAGVDELPPLDPAEALAPLERDGECVPRIDRGFAFQSRRAL